MRAAASRTPKPRATSRTRWTMKPWMRLWPRPKRASASSSATTASRRNCSRAGRSGTGTGTTPIGKSKKTYRFGEAKEMVLDAFGRFHPTFEKEARPFFDERRIDAPAANGKNAAGVLHVRLAGRSAVRAPQLHRQRERRPSPWRTSWATASTLARAQTDRAQLPHAHHHGRDGEHLRGDRRFHDLADTLTSKTDRLALYAHKIESIRERPPADGDVRLRARGLPPPRGARRSLDGAIRQLWLAGQKKMFGSSVKITDDYGAWWSYISHFIHTPFYVYAYAFGELLTLAVMAQVEAKGSAAKDAYIQMLRSAGRRRQTTSSPARHRHPRSGILEGRHPSGREFPGGIGDDGEDALKITRQTTPIREDRLGGLFGLAERGVTDPGNRRVFGEDIRRRPTLRIPFAIDEMDAATELRRVATQPGLDIEKVVRFGHGPRIGRKKPSIRAAWAGFRSPVLRPSTGATTSGIPRRERTMAVRNPGDSFAKSRDGSPKILPGVPIATSGPFSAPSAIACIATMDP